MKGNKRVIKTLNRLLAGELTAMDVYLVQSKVLEDWGYNKLAERLAHEFDDEKEHASRLIARILFLEGMPDMTARDAYDVGKDVKQMFEGDLRLEYEVRDNLNDAIRLASDENDHGTREMLEPLLRDTEEDHIFWLETQLRLIDEIGLKKYLSEQM